MFGESERASEQRESKEAMMRRREEDGRGAGRTEGLPRFLGTSQVPVPAPLELIRTSCPCPRRTSLPYTESAYFA